MSDQPSSGARAPAKPFPWRTLLFVSLAFNILLIGVGVGGAIGRHALMAQAGPVARLAAPRQVMAALPHEARAKVRRELLRAWLASRDDRRALRAANADTLRILRADQYDPEAMKAALSRQRAARFAMTETFHNAAADAFTALSAEERRAAADAFSGTLAGGFSGALPGANSNDSPETPN